MGSKNRNHKTNYNYNLMVLEKFFDSMNEVDYSNDYIIKNDHLIIDYNLNNEPPLALPVDKIDVVTISKGEVVVYGRYNNGESYEIFFNKNRLSII